MLKRISLFLCLVCFLAGNALAHGPNKISADYDSVNQILTITVAHPVYNPGSHYISKLEINKGKQNIFTQTFDQQFDSQKQIIKVLLPKLANSTELKIKAQCNKFGSKAETVTVSVPGYTDVTPAQAQALIEAINDLTIIDVSPHYDEGHLPGAKHYYLANLKKRLNELEKNKSYLVYCHADGPIRSGAQILADNGFAKVYRLKGNYSAWTNAGYPVEK